MRRLLLIGGLLTLGGVGLAQQGPGWINAGGGTPPELEAAALEVTSYEPPMMAAAFSVGEGGAGVTPPPPILNAGNEADVITPEIQALADGLRGDPVAVFQWVRENIAYSHYYGLRKGAALTLLEGSGNDADTSALLVALLRASGVPARYRCGLSVVPLSAEDDNDLEHWLGVDPVAALAESFLLKRGTPATDLFREEIPIGTPTGRYFLRRVWVEADIGGSSPWFDASFKTMTQVAGVNLTTASGYSRSALLTSAGGTVSGAGVSGLDETALANHLRDRTTVLVNHIQTNLPNEKPIKLTGGYSRAALPASSLPLPYNSGETLLTWEMIPETLFSTLRMQLGSIDQTVKLAELRGRRLSLVFDGTGKGQVDLDDTLLWQETAGGTGSVPVTVWFDHPGGTLLDQNDATAPKTYLRTGTYALLYGCEVSQRWLRARQEKLEAYRAAGPDTSLAVRTETLNVMGLNWLLQTQLAGRMLGDIADVAHTYHHRFGRMADEYNGTTGGFYVDVWMQMEGLVARRIGQDVAAVSAADGFVGSAMEHAVIAQTQEGAPAASTVKLGSVANAAGKKLFLADATNWSTVQAALLQVPVAERYSGDDLAVIAAAITAGKTVLLPEAGKLTVQQWKGVGYVTWKNSGGPYEVSMLISGGYSGGYSGYKAPASTYSVITGQQYSAPKLNYTPVTHAVTTGGDPVDMATGQFVHETTDLVVGGGAAPRGLTFSRNYHGGRRQRNDAGLGMGWNHNLNVLAVKRSDVENALGLGMPQQAAAVVVGLHAAWDVFKNREGVKDWATSLLIAKWIVDRLQDNAVSVALGDRVVEFHAQPDGSYTPPPGVTLSLSKDGSGNFVVQERHGNVYAFNTDGKLNTITDLWGRVQTFAYASGKLSTVTDCYGRVLTLSYNGAGLLTGVGDGLGRSVGYTHDAGAKTLTKVTDVEGKDSYFVYDADKRMTALKNHALETLVANVAFDSQDRVITQHSAGNAGKVWRYYYAPGQTIEEDPLEGRITHHFDEKKRNVGRTDALGRRSTVVYDGQDHAVEQRSPLGHKRKAVYDANQNLTASLDALNEDSTAEYDPQQRVTRTVDRNGKQTLVQNYTAYHQPQRVVDATGLITDTTYHTTGGGAGMPHTITVSGALKATHTYTSKGELLRTTFPGGDYVENGYNTWGDVTSVRNARGFTSTSSYNKRRQLLTTTAPGSQAGDPASVVTRTYDDNGDLATVVSPRGHTTTHAYTVQGKPLTTTLPGGAVTTNHYDERDWVDEVTDATGRKVTFTLDAAGQRTHIKDALNHTVVTEYDDDGRAYLSTDPLNHATTTQYTDRGEAEAVAFADHTLANPDYLFRWFDAAGRMTLLENRRGADWQFGYDDAGRSTFTKSPLLRQWTQVYDTQGRAQTVTEPSGQNVTQAYDTRDRVTSRTFKNASGTTAATVSQTYDANGNVLTTTEGANVLSRTYDQRDSVLSYTNAQSEQIGYRYDTSGNLVQLIYPGGKTVTYAYDNRERLSTITDWSSRVTTLEWDAAGRLLKVARPNGTYRVYQYDAAGRMIQVAERKANKRGLCVVRFELDAAGRPLKKLTLPVPQAASDIPAVTATFDADNRMATLLDYGIPHDADGNMQAIFLPLGAYPVGELYWDTRNRLSDVWEQVWAGNVFLGYNQTQFAYDAEGHRTHKTFNGATTRYTVNPHGLSSMSEVLIEHKPNNTKRWYVWGGPAGLLYESQTNSSGSETAVRYYHSGTPTATSTGDVTTWTRDDATGILLSKTDAAARGVTTTYDPASGRVWKRTLARKTPTGADITITYDYDDAGRLKHIDYSDATPDVIHTYYTDGRLKTTLDAAGLHTYDYSGPNGALKGETITGAGLLAGSSWSTTFDDANRVNVYTWNWTGAGSRSIDYDYDSAGRLWKVHAFGHSATYGYHAATGRKETLTYSGAGLTGTWTHDARGRLDAIDWKVGANVLSRHDYGFDALHRRTSAERENGETWRYDYNDRGEVESAVKKADNTAGAAAKRGLQSGYGYDLIGNRIMDKQHTPTSGNGLSEAVWTANALNQITEGENHDSRWVFGHVKQEASLTVTGNSGEVIRDGDEFAIPLSRTGAGNAADWHSLDVTATLAGVGRVVDGTALDVTTQRHGKVWFPTSPEDLQYDDDGNLTQDGRWNFTWNAENRLICAETRADVATATGMPRMRLDMAYDAMGRRIRKVVQSFSSTEQAWQTQSDLRFLYEGMSWNLVAELNLKPETSNLELVRSYAWGTDISGTMDGAGGVGGLLFVQQLSTTVNNSPTSSTISAPCYDGNGNISAYVSVQSGTVSSRHDYDAFGRPVWNELEGTGGKQAAVSPFGFSTKYLDGETGLLSYGFRYYSPGLGRWPSRDPIEEQGGINLYGMVGNDPVNFIDIAGLTGWGPMSNVPPGHNPMTGAPMNQPGIGGDPHVVILAAIFRVQGDALGADGLLRYNKNKGKWTLTKVEVASIDFANEVNVFQHNNVMQAIMRIIAGEKKPIKVKSDGAAYGTGVGNGNNLLGNFTIEMSATVNCDVSGYKVDGTFKIKDHYNFDPKWADYFNGQNNRSFIGQVRTAVGALFIPGTPYDIDSVDIPFTQTANEQVAKWKD